MRVATTLLAIWSSLMIGCVQATEPPRPAGGGYAAPDFTVETFTGDTFHLAEHKGTPVVLNFWESW